MDWVVWVFQLTKGVWGFNGLAGLGISMDLVLTGVSMDWVGFKVDWVVFWYFSGLCGVVCFRWL